MDINLFTAAMRTEFEKGMQYLPAEQLPVAKFTTFVPSTARIESYNWMTPSPGIAEYIGRRRLAKIDQIKYVVENREFDASMSVPTRDIEDDQVGGYAMRFQELGAKAEQFPEQWIMRKLAAGGSTTGFDGSNFFSSTHNFGSGRTSGLPTNFGGGLNALTYTAQGSSDAATYKVVFLVANPKSGPVKPVLYQKRKPPQVGTDAGTPQSMKAKQADYWVDLEGEALFGYWWDAILVTVTNTPNLTDIFAIIDAVIVQFQTFTLPVAAAGDPAIYTHQNMTLTERVGVVVTSPGLSMLFAHALNEDRVGVSVGGSSGGITSNIYRNTWELISTGYMS
jgi:phage major head subunit gpT-like protein